MDKSLEILTLEQWLALLLATDNQSNHQFKTEVLLQDRMLWNSLQTFLQLLEKSCQEHHQNILSNSLLAKLLEQGYKNTSINPNLMSTSLIGNERVFKTVNTEIFDETKDELKQPTISQSSIEQSSDIQFGKHSDNSEEVSGITQAEPVTLEKPTITLAIERNHTSKSQYSEVADLGQDSILLNVNLLQSQQNLSKLGKNVSALSSLPSPNLPLITEPKSRKMPNFQLSNAKVNQPYQGCINSTIQPEVKFTVIDILLPIELGMVFNTDDGSISGSPQISGEFELKFQYKNLLNEILTDVCLFIVNPDPTSLWQKHEPDSTLPYPKAHLDSDFIELNTYNLVAVSRRGRSHEHAGSFRDDDFYISPVDDFTDWSILMVADGAGSANYSREGSRLAVEETGKVLQNRLGEVLTQINTILEQVAVGQSDDDSQQAYNEINATLNPLFQEAITTAIQAIENEATTTNREVRDFSTTLLIALVRQLHEETFIISFWVGDGAIAVYAHDKVRLMGKPDGGQYAGQTNFLTRSILSSLNERMCVGFYDKVKAVILMTDGISDPKFETDAGLQQQERWDSLWSEIEPLLNQKNSKQALLDWMHFLVPGHHDDRTLVIMQPKAYQMISPWLPNHEELPSSQEQLTIPLSSSSEKSVDFSYPNLAKEDE